MLLLGRAQKFFRTRSDARNIDSDQARLRPVAEAIESAIKIAEAERIGLNRRLEDALARAAVTFGNGTDEYLERDEMRKLAADLFACDTPYVCPHGRPVILDFSLTEFDRRFGRTS